MCGKYEKGATCSGDSGGPLICEEDGKAVLHGVVSFNEFESCEISEVGFYANVSESLQFIKGVLVIINTTKVWGEKNGTLSKLAINKESTIFVLSSWNLV